MKARYILFAAAGLMLASCGRSGWSVGGTLSGAGEGTRMALEAYNAGHWYVLDSVTVGKGGRFDYQAGEPMPSADILRLQLPGKGSVYFPVDSVDAIEIMADSATFGTGHTVKGTPLATTVSAIDSIVASTPSIPDLQRALAGFITSDTTGLIAYYTVGKAVGSTPVFDPNDRFGNRIYGAAAQVYAHYRPLDPRGTALRQAYFEGRKSLGRLPQAPEGQIIEVPETALFDIVRYDAKGNEHSLADLAAANKVVLLSFTDYTLEGSPAYNSIINDLYKLYKDKGMAVYHLAFDTNEVSWKEAAVNLPWTAVWNSHTDGVSALASYNVGVLPTTFIIANGEIAARVADPRDLPAEVARYF